MSFAFTFHFFQTYEIKQSHVVFINRSVLTRWSNVTANKTPYQICIEPLQSKVSPTTGSSPYIPPYLHLLISRFHNCTQSKCDKMRTRQSKINVARPILLLGSGKVRGKDSVRSRVLFSPRFLKADADWKVNSAAPHPEAAKRIYPSWPASLFPGLAAFASPRSREREHI